jgi:hypothetical protein
MKIVKGKIVDWVDTLFKRLQKKLMRWTTSQTKLLMGTIKVDPKKNVCHSTLVIETMMQHFFLEIEQKIPQEVAQLKCRRLLHLG